jgi:hypothetical protein
MKQRPSHSPASAQLLGARLVALAGVFVLAVVTDSLHMYGAWRVHGYPHGYVSTHVLPTLLPFLCVAPLAVWSAVYDRNWRITLPVTLAALIAALIAAELSSYFAFAGLSWYL